MVREGKQDRIGCSERVIKSYLGDTEEGLSRCADGGGGGYLEGK